MEQMLPAWPKKYSSMQISSHPQLPQLKNKTQNRFVLVLVLYFWSIPRLSGNQNIFHDNSFKFPRKQVTFSWKNSGYNMSPIIRNWRGAWKKEPTVTLDLTSNSPSFIERSEMQFARRILQSIRYQFWSFSNHHHHFSVFISVRNIASEFDIVRN